MAGSVLCACVYFLVFSEAKTQSTNSGLISQLVLNATSFSFLCSNTGSDASGPSGNDQDAEEHLTRHKREGKCPGAQMDFKKCILLLFWVTFSQPCVIVCERSERIKNLTVTTAKAT